MSYAKHDEFVRKLRSSLKKPSEKKNVKSKNSKFKNTTDFFDEFFLKEDNSEKSEFDSFFDDDD